MMQLHSVGCQWQTKIVCEHKSRGLNFDFAILGAKKIAYSDVAFLPMRIVILSIHS